MVKNALAMQQPQETWVPSLGQEDPLEEEMSTRSGVLAWEIPRTEEPMESQRVGCDRARMRACKLLYPFSLRSLSSASEVF